MLICGGSVAICGVFPYNTYCICALIIDPSPTLLIVPASCNVSCMLGKEMTFEAVLIFCVAQMLSVGYSVLPLPAIVCCPSHAST